MAEGALRDFCLHLHLGRVSIRPQSLHSEPQSARLSGPFDYAQGRLDDSSRARAEKKETAQGFSVIPTGVADFFRRSRGANVGHEVEGPRQVVMAYLGRWNKRQPRGCFLSESTISAEGQPNHGLSRLHSGERFRRALHRSDKYSGAARAAAQGKARRGIHEEI